MNVLVTGSAGYVGSVLVPVLRAGGHRVLGLDAGWFGNDRYADIRVIADIRDDTVDHEWPDVVVHLAGLSNDPMGDLAPVLTYGINRWGTIDVLNRHPLARHVVISSCAVYGQAHDTCTEESPVNPQTVYAGAKAMVDDYVANRDDPRAIVLRLGTVYGPSPNHRLDLVVNKMVHDGLAEGVLTATGNAARPLTHIDDVARAIRWAVEGKERGVFNVVGENIRMVALAHIVADATGTRARVAPSGADTRDYMASGSKLLAAGWAPNRTVASSVLTLVQMNPPGHVRIDQLRALMASGALNPKTLRSAA